MPDAPPNVLHRLNNLIFAQIHLIGIIFICFINDSVKDTKQLKNLLKVMQPLNAEQLPNQGHLPTLALVHSSTGLAASHILYT